MFKCAKCSALEDEVKFLRGEVRRLGDQLLAVSNPAAYNSLQFAPPSGEFYGSEEDEFIEYDRVTGAKILVTKKQ